MLEKEEFDTLSVRKEHLERIKRLSEASGVPVDDLMEKMLNLLIKNLDLPDKS